MSADTPAVEDVAEVLRRTRAWRGAPEESVRTAACVMQPIRFERGERLLRRGRRAEHLIVIVRGSAEIRVGGVAGVVSTVAALGAGDCTGQMSLLSNEPSIADVVADSDIEALAMPAADFESIVRRDAEMLHRFVKIISDRLVRADFAVSVSREQHARFEELLLEPSRGETEFFGKSSAVRRLRQRVAELGPSAAPVLVSGEDGTKKEVVARMVHVAGDRADGPVFVANCAQITEEPWGDRLLGARGGDGLLSRTACFMDVAQGGTIILRDIEMLPAGIQERLAEFLRRRDAQSGIFAARVVATCADGLPESGDGAIVTALLAAFGESRIRTPPLRDRKRDIPALANRMLRAHAVRLDRPARAFDDQAMTRLVSYDYRFGNERELDAAVARAALLADGETVHAEEIFLGPPPDPRPVGVDLLHLRGLDLKRVVVWLQRAGRLVAAVAFVALLGACFLDSSGPVGRRATAIVWSLGWPALALSFAVVGRAACSVCPMGGSGAIASRLRTGRRSVPAWLKERDYQFVLAGFFLIVLAEETTGMRESPLLTGLLLVTILASAVAVGFWLPRRTWCRHLCPLGGLAGICGSAGVVELRPSFDVCSARCTGHACFKGTEHVPGCPMFNHVMFVDGNQDCILCLDCVRSCPNDSPQLNLRMPGRELWAGHGAGVEFGTAVLVFAGMLVALVIVQALERAPGTALGAWMAANRFVFVAGALVVCSALPLLCIQPVRAALRREGDERAAKLFWRRIGALTPIVAAGFVAYQLAYVPGLPWLHAVIADDRAGSDAWASVSVLSFLQVGIVTAGLLTSCAVLWHVDRSADADVEPWARRWRRDAALVAVLTGYWALLLGSMLAR